MQGRLKTRPPCPLARNCNVAGRWLLDGPSTPALQSLIQRALGNRGLSTSPYQVGKASLVLLLCPVREPRVQLANCAACWQLQGGPRGTRLSAGACRRRTAAGCAAEYPEHDLQTGRQPSGWLDTQAVWWRRTPPNLPHPAALSPYPAPTPQGTAHNQAHAPGNIHGKNAACHGGGGWWGSGITAAATARAGHPSPRGGGALARRVPSPHARPPQGRRSPPQLQP